MRLMRAMFNLAVWVTEAPGIFAENVRDLWNADMNALERDSVRLRLTAQRRKLRRTMEWLEARQDWSTAALHPNIRLAIALRFECDELHERYVELGGERMKLRKLPHLSAEIQRAAGEVVRMQKAA